MKKLGIFAVLAVMGLALLMYAPPVDWDETMTADEMRRDYAKLVGALKEGAPTLYLYTPEAGMDAYFRRMEKQFSEPMLRREFCRRVYETVAAVNDAHTQVMAGRGSESWFKGEKSRLPFKLRILNGRAYVERDYGIGEAWIGSQVLTLNDRPMNQIIEDMSPLVSTDGANRTGVYYQLGETTPFALRYRMLYGPAETFKIQFRKPGGEEEELVVDGITGGQLAKAYRARYAGKGGEPIRLEWRENTPVLFFGNFGQPEVNGKPVAQFLQEGFEEIARRGTENLIIDLSGNTGGDLVMPELLAAYLLDAPFQLTASNTMTKRAYDFYGDSVMTPTDKFLEDMVQRSDGAWWNPKLSRTVEPLEPGYRGKLYVITEGMNHSSATLFLNALHRAGRAVFIGEEAMGAYHRFAAGMGGVLHLKNADLMVMIPTMVMEMPKAPFPHKDRGVQPDHKVTPTMADITSGREAGVEYALKLMAGAAP